jgi:hypothetical protein
MPINPPWRTDPLQMPVNINWGIPGACVITSNANQVFFASDPTQWHEFDIPGWRDATYLAQHGYPLWRYGAAVAACDLLHKSFWIAAEFIISSNRADTTVNMYTSPTPDFAGGWRIADNFTTQYSSPGPQYWVNTGLLNSYGGPFGAVDGSGPWTVDGGLTPWKTTVPPDALQQGFEYPVSKWNDLYLQGNLLSNAEGEHAINVNFPSGWSAIRGKIAAGNGVIVAILSSSASQKLRVGVTKDNHTWTMLSAIGDIPSITPNSGGPPPGNFDPPLTHGFPYVNFEDALLTFVPNFGPTPHGQTGSGLFVFTACTAQPYTYQYWKAPDAPGTGAVYTLTSATGMVADPLQIYTSPDGIDWTKQFQAGYTNNSRPPSINPPGNPFYIDQYGVQQDPPLTHTVNWPFAPRSGWADTEELGPVDGGFIQVGIFPPYTDYNGTGFTDATGTTPTWAAWQAQAEAGAVANSYSLSGSMPGSVDATFQSPPAYLYLNPFSVPSGYYGDQTFTYSSVYLGRNWGFADGVPQFGEVNSFTMTPQSIAGSGYAFPIIKTGLP